MEDIGRIDFFAALQEIHKNPEIVIENKELHDWAYPILEEYWSEMGGDESFKPVLYISDDVRSPVTLFGFINLPSILVDYAMNDKKWGFVLYSDIVIPVSGMAVFACDLGHEIWHNLYNTGDSDMDEALGDIAGFEKSMQYADDGDTYAAAFLSSLLVEANLLGYANIERADELKLPYKLSDQALSIIQGELDHYHANPCEVLKEYQRRRDNSPLHEHHNGRHVKGFVRLLKQE